MSVLSYILGPMIAGTYAYGRCFQEIFAADNIARHRNEPQFNHERQRMLEWKFYSHDKDERAILNEAFGRPYPYDGLPNGEEGYRAAVRSRAVHSEEVLKEAQVYGAMKGHSPNGIFFGSEKFLDDFERIRGFYVQYKNFDRYDIQKEQIDTVDGVYHAWEKCQNAEVEDDFDKASMVCDSIDWAYGDEARIKLQLEVLTDIFEQNLELCCDTENVLALYIPQSASQYL